MATTEGIFIVPTGGQDRHGDPLPTGEPWYISSAVLLPRKSFDSTTGGGVQILSGFEVFVRPPPPREIMATDTVIARGDDYTVEGVPGLYPFKMLQFILKRVGE